MIRYICLLLAGLWMTSVTQAETVFVTDMLQLDMYALPDLSGGSIKKLRSGDKVELLTRDGRLAKVQAGDGKQGWVKGLYLVPEEPARTRVNQLERSNESLQSTVKQLRSELSAEQAKVAELQLSQDGREEQSKAIEAEAEALRIKNAQLENSLSAYAMNVPVSWLLIAMLIAVIGGFAGGWFWIDSRSRARHGGYRIY